MMNRRALLLHRASARQARIEALEAKLQACSEQMTVIATEGLLISRYLPSARRKPVCRQFR